MIVADYRSLLERWRRVAICLGLQTSVGICQDMPVFLGVAGICLASHSETLCNLVWGPGSSPVLQPLAPGKILSRAGRTTIRSPSWSYPQDGRTPLRTLESAENTCVFWLGFCDSELQIFKISKKTRNTNRSHQTTSRNGKK